MDMRGKVLTKTGTALPGVAVSNGRHICRTNDDGGFCLPYWEKSAAVFVMLLTNGQDDWYILTENHSEDYIFYIEPSEISGRKLLFSAYVRYRNRKYTAMYLYA